MQTLPGSLLLAWLSLVALQDPDPDSTTACSGCTRALPESEVSEEDLRLEWIKQQILMKLRMEEPPRVTRPVLPDVLVHGHLLSSGEREQGDEDPGLFAKDDFYGTTQEVVIFPENTSTHNCYTKDTLKPSSCFRFRLTREVTTRSVVSAELWVHKVGSVDSNSLDEDESSNTSITYSVVEVSPHPKHDGFTKRVVAIEHTTDYPGWLKFELAPAVRTWALRKHLTHALEISCSGCNFVQDSSVSLAVGQRPFIVVHADTWRNSQKPRRDLSCTVGSLHCCKKYFKVDFRDINWDTWIIEPRFYVANICQGSCLADLSASRHHHTTVIRRYLRKHSLPENSFNLSLCCSASRMSPLTLIYMDEHNNVYKKKLPNMIVESCDCT